ncbi:unnamed protein product [Calypogeia fissa]
MALEYQQPEAKWVVPHGSTIRGEGVQFGIKGELLGHERCSATLSLWNQDLNFLPQCAPQLLSRERMLETLGAAPLDTNIHLKDVANPTLKCFLGRLAERVFAKKTGGTVTTRDLAVYADIRAHPDHTYGWVMFHLGRRMHSPQFLEDGHVGWAFLGHLFFRCVLVGEPSVVARMRKVTRATIILLLPGPEEEIVEVMTTPLMFLEEIEELAEEVVSETTMEFMPTLSVVSPMEYADLWVEGIIGDMRQPLSFSIDKVYLHQMETYQSATEMGLMEHRAKCSQIATLEQELATSVKMLEKKDRELVRLMGDQSELKTLRQSVEDLSQQCMSWEEKARLLQHQLDMDDVMRSLKGKASAPPPAHISAEERRMWVKELAARVAAKYEPLLTKAKSTD